MTSSLSVSSWSLHRLLGSAPIYGADTAPPAAPSAADTLLALPAKMAAAGFTTYELCHFHLPTTDPAYLAALRAAQDQAGIALHCLLIDGGDLTDAEHAARDEAWIAAWLPVAAALGARTARVIAGNSKPSPEALAQSAAGLGRLAAQGAALGVQVVTENFKALTGTPEAALWLLDTLKGAVGFKLDYGNWSNQDKYAAIQALAARSESVHAKADFDAPYEVAREDYVRCLDITRAAGFNGPYTLIYSEASGPDEWRGLEAESDYVRKYLQ